MSCNSFLVLFLLFLTICSFSRVFCSEDNPKVSELVLFDKLAQYASLFAYLVSADCNQKAEKIGSKYVAGVDADTEWARRVKCCATWDLRDCWVKFANDKLDAKQAEQVLRWPYAIIDNLDEFCRDYPDGSYKCHYPVWLIVAIVLMGVTLLAAGVYCAVRFYGRRITMVS